MTPRSNDDNLRLDYTAYVYDPKNPRAPFDTRLHSGNKSVVHAGRIGCSSSILGRLSSLPRTRTTA